MDEVIAKENSITDAAKELLVGLIGQQCTRKEVGEMRSLSLGFGAEAANNSEKKSLRRYRVWEMGTYSSSWRIVRSDTVLLSKQDAKASQDLDALLQPMDLGRFVSLSQISAAGVRIELDNGIAVEFSGIADDDDEFFHVFCPNKLYVEFSANGWQVGRSGDPRAAT